MDEKLEGRRKTTSGLEDVKEEGEEKEKTGPCWGLVWGKTAKRMEEVGDRECGVCTPGDLWG